MSVKVEQLEHNMAQLTIEVPASDFTKAIESVYAKQKNKISIQGFRKGKVPRKIVEKMYGAEVFYEDAANELLPEAYGKAADECELDIVSMPTIDIVTMKEGENFVFTAKVATRPDVELGKYVGVTVTKIDCSVTDEEIDEEINKELERNARTVTVERKAKDGDTVIIDFEGYSGGKKFDGGTAQNQTLVLGSHSFIDNFEEQLIGCEAGDDVDVNVTFPENYHEQSLAGEDALFKVKVHEVKEKQIPALDDEFAQDVSEFDTVAEYKESVKKTIEERKLSDAKLKKEDEAVEKVINKSKMDIPDAMIDTQVQKMLDEFAQRLSMQGMNIQQYLQFSGTSVDELKTQMRPDAEKTVKGSLVLEKIADTENIEATEEEIEEELKNS